MPWVGASTGLFASLSFFSTFVDSTGKSADLFTRAWAETIKTAAMMKMSTEGLDRFDPKRTYVVVSNHQSHMDTIVLFNTSPVPLRMLAKQELFSIPILGPAMKRVGHIEIDRSKKGSDFDSLMKQVERLKQRRQSVMVFAEGSRSQDGTLKSFKRGAFIIAEKYGLPILPVAIHGTKDILPAKSLDMSSGKVTVAYHAPIEPEGKTVQELSEQTWKVIAESLERLAAH
jgi:1-acyl-sn-glycerol-3-phosphate acyltransferase